MNAETMQREIRGKIAELAARLGNDSAAVTDDDILPFTGLLDSAGLMELVAWYEDHFRLPLKQEEINIDNFGSIRAMTEFALRR
jgi:D-alanine--poly(phosphoribitol) ligase subunit 2